MTSAVMHHHLAYNHFPPVSPVWAEPCEAAIALCNAREQDGLVTLPEGIAFRDRDDDKAPAWALVESFHLEGFLDSDEDCWFDLDEPDSDEVLGQLVLVIFA